MKKWINELKHLNIIFTKMYQTKLKVYKMYCDKYYFLFHKLLLMDFFIKIKVSIVYVIQLDYVLLGVQ